MSTFATIRTSSSALRPDWLLNVEINRWALDRGQGIEAFARLCERKLDEMLRLKINMVLMDGFGWGLEQRFREYGPLMRR